MVVVKVGSLPSSPAPAGDPAPTRRDPTPTRYLSIQLLSLSFSSHLIVLVEAVRVEEEVVVEEVARYRGQIV